MLQTFASILQVFRSVVLNAPLGYWTNDIARPAALASSLLDNANLFEAPIRYATLCKCATTSWPFIVSIDI